MKVKTMLCIGMIAAFAFSHQSKSMGIRNHEQNGSPAPLKESAIPRGKRTEGFNLFLKTDKSKYSIGELIDIELKFQNLERNQAGLTIGGKRWYKLEILRPNGSLAPLTKIGEAVSKDSEMTPSFRGGPNSPGTTVGAHYRTAHLDFDLTQLGEYQLRVACQVPSIADPKKMVTIYSNVVKITFEAPKKAEKVEDEAVEETKSEATEK